MPRAKRGTGVKGITKQILELRKQETIALADMYELQQKLEVLKNKYSNFRPTIKHLHENLERAKQRVKDRRAARKIKKAYRDTIKENKDLKNRKLDITVIGNIITVDGKDHILKDDETLLIINCIPTYCIHSRSDILSCIASHAIGKGLATYIVVDRKRDYKVINDFESVSFDDKWIALDVLKYFKAQVA